MLYITIIVGMILLAALLAKAMDQHHARVVMGVMQLDAEEQTEEEEEGHSLAEHLAIAGDKATGVLEVVAGQRKHFIIQGFPEELADQMTYTLYQAMLGS